MTAEVSLGSRSTALAAHWLGALFVELRLVPVIIRSVCSDETIAAPT